jgi:hypothetical protein
MPRPMKPLDKAVEEQALVDFEQTKAIHSIS